MSDKERGQISPEISALIDQINQESETRFPLKTLTVNGKEVTVLDGIRLDPNCYPVSFSRSGFGYVQVRYRRVESGEAVLSHETVNVQFLRVSDDFETAKFRTLQDGNYVLVSGGRDQPPAIRRIYGSGFYRDIQDVDLLAFRVTDPAEPEKELEEVFVLNILGIGVRVS